MSVTVLSTRGVAQLAAAAQLAAKVAAALVTAVGLAVCPVAARTEALGRMEAEKEAPAAAA